MSRSCPRCATPPPDTASFCAQCGQALAAATGHEPTRVATPSLLAQHARPKTTLSNGPGDCEPGSPSGLIPAAGAPAGQREILVLAIDTSGSMDGPFAGGTSKLAAAVRAGANLILNKIKVDPLDEVGIVSFTDKASVESAPLPCGAHKNELIQILQRLTADGGTDIDAGLRAAGDCLDFGRAGVTRRIVLLTDGHGGEPIRTVRSLKARGVVFDIIGVGDTPEAVNEKELRAIASVVAGELRYRFIKHAQALVTHYTGLASKTQLAS